MSRKKTTRQELLNAARDLLIGFLCEPTDVSDSDVKAAITNLAQDIDCSYERALRLILSGHA